MIFGIKFKFYNSMKKEFDIKPIYCKKFMKIEREPSSEKVTDFHNKEIPAVGSYLLVSSNINWFCF